jgi:hypothetical protein
MAGALVTCIQDLGAVSAAEESSPSGIGGPCGDRRTALDEEKAASVLADRTLEATTTCRTSTPASVSTRCWQADAA